MNARSAQLVLILLDRHLGNFIVASSVIRSIVAARSDVPVALVLRRQFTELVDRMPGLPAERIWDETPDAGRLDRLRHFAALVHRVRKLRPETVVDFGGGHAGRRLAMLSGAGRRICARPGKGMTWWAVQRPLVPTDGDPIAPPGPLRHRQQIYWDLAHTLGCTVPPEWPRLAPTAGDRAAWAEHRRALGLEGRRFAAVHVGAGKAHKCWPAAGFAQVLDWLAARDVAAVLMGSPTDLPNIEAVRARAAASPIVVAGRLGFGEQIAMLEQCDAFLGNDSGPMHMAAAAGAPLVALFGPTDPRRWGPLAERCRILRAPQAMAAGRNGRNGRKKHRYADARRIDSLPVDHVIEALDELLTQ